MYCIVMYCIVMYCIVMYCIVMYCIVMYCIVLHCFDLYCIASYDTCNSRILPQVRGSAQGDLQSKGIVDRKAIQAAKEPPLHSKRLGRSSQS